jgi:hypothetical protein
MSKIDIQCLRNNCCYQTQKLITLTTKNYLPSVTYHKPVHIITKHVTTIHFNVILPPTIQFLKSPLHDLLPQKLSTYVFLSVKIAHASPSPPPPPPPPQAHIGHHYAISTLSCLLLITYSPQKFPLKTFKFYYFWIMRSSVCMLWLH